MPGCARWRSGRWPALNAIGIGRGDRVAIVLPNGPEMAASFVAIACGATTAPLNPAYKRGGVRVLPDRPEGQGAGRAAGRRNAGPRRAAAPGRAGGRTGARATRPASSTLAAAHGAPRRQPGQAGPDDVALVLHTSGTTARPKIVPLTHTNVTASAGNIARTLRLTAEDRCLNIMPLFHIHGLMAATLASLAGGGAVMCTPGFNALRFFALARCRAAQLVHGGADHAPGDPGAGRAQCRDHRARPRCASSAPPPPRCRRRSMKDARGRPSAPGDRELRHDRGQPPDGSNPLPPGARKPGIVGLRPGPRSRIMDDDGTCCRRARSARS